MRNNKHRKTLGIAITFIVPVLAGPVHAQSLDDILNGYLKSDASETEKTSEPASDEVRSLDDILSEQLNGDDFQSGKMSSPNWNTDSFSGSGLEDHLQEMARFAEFEIPRDTNAKYIPGNEKISANLRALMNQEKSLDTFGFQQKAFELGVETKQNLVYVTITAESESESKAIGWDIPQGFMSQFRNKTYALLPVSELDKLAEKNSVYLIEPQEKVYPLDLCKSGKVVTEGVQSVDVSRLHQANVTGKKVKIGVIDFGFHRYAELQQKGEVPPPIATKTFNSARQLENGNIHGTACAEIIHDMAPDADLFLAVIDGHDGQIIQAAEWLAQQGVDIISFSGGKHSGPHNGTDILDLLVDYITQKYNILWVNAAGNEGVSHLPLKLEDKDGNQLIDIKINGKQIDVAEVGFKSPGFIRLVWDDWGNDPSKPSSTQDLDLYLLVVDPRTKRAVVKYRSENPQNGRSSPMELIRISENDLPLYGGVVVIKKNATRSVPIHLHVSQGVSEIKPSSPVGSIAIPATSRKALAVGAVNVQNLQLEPFSSQGPTDDGRLKPNVSAPDYNSSLAYGKPPSKPGRFSGTSAACPHVSGFAALLKQRFNPSSPDELRRLVEKNVRFLGSPEPNNQYGRGYITAQAIRVGSPSTGAANDEPNPGGNVDELERALDEILGR